MDLAEGSQPVLSLRQVIERTEQQDCICALVGLFELARISNLSRSQGMLRLLCRLCQRLLHMTRHGINEMHLISTLGEPKGIGAGAAADIEQTGRRRWNVAK